MLDIHIQTAVSDARVPEPDLLRDIARRALRETMRGTSRKTAAAEITIRIVDEAESRQLNKRWRDIDKPTNVLSFPLSRGGIAPMFMGDLVLCAPLVAREAAEQGKPAAAHWAHLVIHGVLHLLGHDHIKEDEAAAMEERETALMRQCGYGDPYLA